VINEENLPVAHRRVTAEAWGPHLSYLHQNVVGYWTPRRDRERAPLASVRTSSAANPRLAALPVGTDLRENSADPRLPKDTELFPLLSGRRQRVLRTTSRTPGVYRICLAARAIRVSGRLGRIGISKLRGRAHHAGRHCNTSLFIHDGQQDCDAFGSAEIVKYCIEISKWPANDLQGGSCERLGFVRSMGPSAHLEVNSLITQTGTTAACSPNRTYFAQNRRREGRTRVVAT